MILALRALVAAACPAAELKLDEPLQEQGAWWLDITLAGVCVTVLWRPWLPGAPGLGVYIPCSAVEAGFGTLPDEHHLTIEATLARVLELLTPPRPS